MSQGRILIVDDEDSIREYLSMMLEREGYDVVATADGKKALRVQSQEAFDVVITDIQLKGMSGIEVLGAIREQDPALPVIIVTGHASQESAIEALNLGAFYYLLKPVSNDELKQVVRNALEMRRLKEENVELERALHPSGERAIVGTSEGMTSVFDIVDRVARTSSTVLLYGESGTGKELVARAVHARSARAQGRFVSINCGALPETLLESELFGHVKGSFTGAIRDKRGLFVVAEGGTFFLDEVSETSPAIQVKLLRVLQEREVVPVGGTKPTQVDVRVIAATNAELEKLIREGKFRADLYYRLNVIPIRIPPLRERRDDVPLLVRHFLERFTGGAKSVSDDAMEILVGYDWPGNVRELENVIERAVILARDKTITAADLNISIFPERLRKRAAAAGPAESGLGVSGLTLDEVERRYLIQTLEETGWKKKQAADVLGINPSTLYRKLQRYGMADRAEED
ncbi:MAG: sigma-54-dependent Fis family transcriptional regulator [Candidatus Eisenbacteria bacterium]|nr:sigma-54-dependent Fis family transcriptional regulator [Candidatus Eisenbacteria bacterium]